MNKSIALTLTFVFLAASFVIVSMPAFSSVEVTSDWTSKAPMQTARSRMGVEEVRGKIYAIGGDKSRLLAYQSIEASISEVVNTTEEYDPTTDTWVFKAPMPTPRCSFAVAVHQNKIYCIGGYINGVNATGVNEVYDPAKNTWETKESMPTPRAGLQANVVNGKIYLIGGSSDKIRGLSTSQLGVNEVYNPATDTWTTKTSAPNRITSAASAVADGKIYFLATNSRLDTGAFIQSYNPTQDSWSTGAFAPTYGELSTTSSVTTSVFAPKKIVFFSEASTYVYYPRNNSWAEGTAMPTDRGYAGVAVVNDEFYVVGGIKAPFRGLIVATGAVAANEKYTPNDLQPVKADRIYIKANGSIEPATANITTDDNVFYNFTGDLHEQLVIQRDNIIVNGNDYTIQGTTAIRFGIALFQRQNVIVRNITVKYFEVAGIGIEESTHIIIFGNTMQNNLNNGIRLYSASDNVIAGNNITSNKYMGSIYLWNNSNNNTIYGNKMWDNSISFIIEDSKDNHIYHNIIDDTHVGVRNSSNSWDNGYPSGGNYWGDYSGTDYDGDGIGYKPYVIDENNKDNYPLIAPFNVSSVTLELPEWAYQTPSQDTPTTEPPSIAIVVASIALVVVISLGLLVYFKKLRS